MQGVKRSSPVAINPNFCRFVRRALGQAQDKNGQKEREDEEYFDNLRKVMFLPSPAANSRGGIPVA